MNGKSLPLPERIPEKEVMDEEEHVLAYAGADFSVPHEMFVDLMEARFGRDIEGLYIDLGCGPCDIAVRVARRFPRVFIHAIDASRTMLSEAEKIIDRNGLGDRIRLFTAKLPLSGQEPLSRFYDGIISNSLLHHMPSQALFWQSVEELVRDGSIIFVMDLYRPDNTSLAHGLVEKYSGSEPKILKRDFYNSLLAAYRVAEVTDYLKNTKLSFLTVEKVSDRHLIAWGRK